MRRLMVLGLAVVLLPGCAGDPMTAREKATLGGAAIGAAVGGLAGSTRGKATTGALIGAAAGGALGYGVGSAQQEEARRHQGQPPVSPPAPQQQAAVQVPGQYAGDPTQGEFVNTTPFTIHLFIDPDGPQNQVAPSATLNPGESRPAVLDVGQHRIKAEAWRDTQLGKRMVGRYDRTILVDVRANGWSLRFSEGDFR
ncbi:MAG: glycine zipper domain-containing protein [Candidatus Methylomirabilales bacterium]